MTDEYEPEVVEFLIRHSESIANIVKALAVAQRKFEEYKTDQSAEVETKSGGKYRYTYADLGGVIGATRKHLNDVGIAVVQAPATTKDGMVEVETMLAHESGEWIASNLKIKPIANDNRGVTPQVVGSTITYARRYALQAMLCVAPEDDDAKGGSGQGGNRNQQQQQQRDRGRQQQQRDAQPATASDGKSVPAGMKIGIERAAGALGLEIERIILDLTNEKKRTIDELTFGEGNQLLTSLQKRQR
jgi:hypothetical protein